MPAKIRLDLEDNTKEGFSSLNTSLDNVAKHADKAADSQAEFNSELDPSKSAKSREELKKLSDVMATSAANVKKLSLAEEVLNDELRETKSAISVSEMNAFAESLTRSSGEVKKLESELNELTDAQLVARRQFEAMSKSLMNAATAKATQETKTLSATLDQTALSASKTASAMRDIGQAADTIHPAASKAGLSLGTMAKAAIGLFALHEIIGRVLSAVNSLAAGGSASMQDLQSSFAAVGKAMVAIAEMPGVAKAISWISTGIKSASTAVENLDKVWVSTKETVALLTATTAEYFNVVEQGTAAQVRQDRARRIEAQEHAALLKAQTTNREQFDKILLESSKRNEEQRASAAIAEKTDIYELQTLRFNAWKAIQRMREEAKATPEEQAAAASRLIEIDNRLVQVQKDNQQRLADQKKQIMDKAAEDQAAEQQKLLDAQQQAEAEALQEAQAERKRRSDERFAAEKAAAEQRLQLLAQEQAEKKAILDKAAAAQQGNVQGLAARFTPRQIATQIATQRGQDALEQFRGDNAEAIRLAKSAGTDSKQYADLVRRQKQEVAAAQRSGYRDVAQGRVSGEEVIEAQQTLVGRVADQGVATGRLGREQAAAIKEAANVLGKQQADIIKTADEVREVRQQLAILAGDAVARGQQSGNQANRARLAGRQ